MDLLVKLFPAGFVQHQVEGVQLDQQEGGGPGAGNGDVLCPKVPSAVQPPGRVRQLEGEVRRVHVVPLPQVQRDQHRDPGPGPEPQVDQALAVGEPDTAVGPTRRRARRSVSSGDRKSRRNFEIFHRRQTFTIYLGHSYQQCCNCEVHCVVRRSV